MKKDSPVHNGIPRSCRVLVKITSNDYDVDNLPISMVTNKYKFKLIVVPLYLSGGE